KSRIALGAYKQDRQRRPIDDLDRQGGIGGNMSQAGAEEFEDYGVTGNYGKWHRLATAGGAATEHVLEELAIGLTIGPTGACPGTHGDCCRHPLAVRVRGIQTRCYR